MMRALSAIFVWLFLSALASAQGYINPPIFAPGIIFAPAGTTVNTNIATSYNHPTDLSVISAGNITTWTIALPNPGYDGQTVYIGCGAGSASSISVTATSPVTVASGGFTSCTANSGNVNAYQFSAVRNTWLILNNSTVAATVPVSGITGLGSGVATALALPVTGSGSTVLATSPTLVTPALGTPSSGVATNLSGTAAGLTAGNVTTNANLTGPITSIGNATSVASQTGTGSTFVMSVSPSLTTPAVTGTTGGACAGAGLIGQCITSNVASPGTAISNGVAFNVTSISLTAGDWLVYGNVCFDPASTTVITAVYGWTSSTSATLPTLPNQGAAFFMPGADQTAGNEFCNAVGSQRVNISSGETFYLSGQADFGTSTATVFGYLEADRIQ